MNALKLTIALLTVLVMASALLVIKARQQSRSSFVLLGEARQVRDQLNTQYGQLQLEKSVWATHGRIERIAREQLKMSIPAQQAVVLIQP